MNLSNKATQAVRANAENMLAADWLSGISSNVLNSRFAAVPELFGTLLDASKPDMLWENSDKVYKSDADAKAVDFKNPTFFVPEQGDKSAVGLTGSLKGDPFANVANREWTILDESAIKALDTTAFGKKEAELPEMPNLSKGFYEASDRMSRQAAADIQRAYDAVGDTALGRTLTDVVAASAGMATDTFLGMGAGSMPSIILNGFASGAREARYAGADADTAMLAGIASAAVSYGTEHISGLGLGQLTGVNGTLDEVTKRAISRAVNRVGNTVGKSVLNTTLQIIVGGLGEGFEEVLEAVLDPLVQRIYKEGPLKESYSNGFLSEMLYDGLIGAITGLLGNGLAQVQSFGSDSAGYEGVDRMLNGTATEQDAINVLQSEAAMRQFERSVGVDAGEKRTVDTMFDYTIKRAIETESMTQPDNMARYAKQIDSAFDGSVQMGEIITLGTTPKILQCLGAESRELTMTRTAARKIAYPEKYFGGKHNLGIPALKSLPYQLCDPVAVLESNTQENSMVVLTQWEDRKGKPVIVPIHLDKRGRVTLENRIASAYGKGEIDSMIGAGGSNVIYTKNNEDIRRLLSNRLPLPATMADDTLIGYNMSRSKVENNEFFDWLLDVKNREMPPRRKPDNGFLERLLGIENNEGKPKDNSRDKDRDGSYSR